MSSKSLFAYSAGVYIALTLLGFGAPETPGDSQRPLSEAEIISLVPSAVDGPPSPEEEARRKRIIEAGPRAHQALFSKLLETDNPHLAGSILSILTDTHADKNQLRSAITKLIRKKSPSSEDWEGMLGVLAGLLAEIGGDDDIPVLLSMLSDHASSVRVNSLRGLAKIGNEAAIGRIEAWLADKRRITPSQLQAKDPSLREAEKTLQAIRKRSEKSKQPHP